MSGDTKGKLLTCVIVGAIAGVIGAGSLIVFYDNFIGKMSANLGFPAAGTCSQESSGKVESLLWIVAEPNRAFRSGMNRPISRGLHNPLYSAFAKRALGASSGCTFRASQFLGWAPDFRFFSLEPVPKLTFLQIVFAAIVGALVVAIAAVPVIIANQRKQASVAWIGLLVWAVAVYLTAVSGWRNGLRDVVTLTGGSVGGAIGAAILGIAIVCYEISRHRVDLRDQ